ncbi:MAG: sulfite exporter TauE/SafE family protein [Actinomycetes bacterium]
MHIDPLLALGGLTVGIAVGMTGMGGGALMTPVLIIFFGVAPSTAISSDLVAAMFMKPVGGFIHLRRKAVNLRIVGLLALGSVPAAFLGAWLLSLLHASANAEKKIQIVLGSALLIGCVAMALRAYLGQHRDHDLDGAEARAITARPALTVLIGALGGVMVGLTSVGSGSLIMVMLLAVYPMAKARGLVGTDIVQAIPLTMAAALGQLVFGHIEFSLTAAILVGGIPGVIIGSLLAHRAPERILRPIIGLVLLASGLKYIGVPPTVLGLVIAVAVIITLSVSFLVRSVNDDEVHHHEDQFTGPSIPV